MTFSNKLTRKETLCRKKLILPTFFECILTELIYAKFHG